MTDVVPYRGEAHPMAENEKTRERDLRIPTTPKKLAAAVLKPPQRRLRADMALPHDLVSPADDVTALVR